MKDLSRGSVGCIMYIEKFPSRLWRHKDQLLSVLQIYDNRKPGSDHFREWTITEPETCFFEENGTRKSTSKHHESSKETNINSFKFKKLSYKCCAINQRIKERLQNSYSMKTTKSVHMICLFENRRSLQEDVNDGR